MKGFIGLFLGSRCIKRDYEKNPKAFIAVMKLAAVASLFIVILGIVSAAILETSCTVLGIVVRYGGILAITALIVSKNEKIADESQKDKGADDE